MSKILNIIKHPLTRDLDLDDPGTTYLRKRIIKEKRFLNRIYRDWYEWIVSAIPGGEKGILELGSGAGFLHQYVPGLITSEVFPCPFVKAILDGRALPFRDNMLRAIVMVDVLHHIPDVRSFFFEAQRCLDQGGAIIMIEPWVNSWSSFVYRYLHHEPFDPQAREWGFPFAGPLSGANSALPWILFERDKNIFEREFKLLSIYQIKVEMPFLYLLSGGVSMRSLVPSFTFEFWKLLETLLGNLNNKLGMFSKIILKKVNEL